METGTAARPRCHHTAEGKGVMRVGARNISLVETTKQVGSQISRDNVSILASALAYRFFLALFPFFIFLTALGGLVARVSGIQNPADQILGYLGNLPPGLAGVVRDQLRAVLEAQQPALLSVGILGAIWASSAGMNAVIKAMNLAYDVEETRPWWKKTLLGTGMTLLAGTFLVLAFVLLVAGQFIGGLVANALGLGGVWQAVAGIVNWALALVLLMMGTGFMYWAAPNIDLPWRWVWPGTVLFAVGWLLATLLFAFYAMNFGSYNATYGALGGVVVLLVWFYLTAFILLVGAEVNAVIHEQQAPTKMDRERRVKQQEAKRAQPDKGELAKDRRLAA